MENPFELHPGYKRYNKYRNHDKGYSLAVIREPKGAGGASREVWLDIKTESYAKIRRECLNSSVQIEEVTESIDSIEFAEGIKEIKGNCRNFGNISSYIYMTIKQICEERIKYGRAIDKIPKEEELENIVTKL